MSTANPVMSGAVTAVLVIAIILGTFLTLGSLFGMAATAFGGKLQELSMVNSGGDPTQEAFGKLQLAQNRVQRIALPPLVIHLVLSSLILWSAVSMFRGTEGSRQRLRQWFFYAMCFEPFALVVTFYNQYQMLEPTQEFYQVTTPQFAKMAVGISLLTAAMILVFSLVKMAYFWWGRRVLDV